MDDFTLFSLVECLVVLLMKYLKLIDQETKTRYAKREHCIMFTGHYMLLYW